LIRLVWSDFGLTGLIRGLVGGAVKAVGVAVHVTRIEMAVQVEGRGDAGMAHDLLQHLRRVPGLDHERRGCMPKIMDAEPGADACPAASGQKGFSPPVGQAQDMTAGGGEHEIVGFLAVHQPGKLARQEPGDGNGACLMGLRRSQDDVAADVGVSAPHIDPPPDQIDVAHAQGSCLAPAKARVAEKEHKHPPRAGYERQAMNLLMSQKDVIAALGAWVLETAGRVGATTSAGSARPQGRAPSFTDPWASRQRHGIYRKDG